GAMCWTSDAGRGDNAAYLASRGYNVTAVDAAPTAIKIARERAAAKRLQIEFLVADATRLDGPDNRFDSSLYHCLTEEARPRLVRHHIVKGRRGPIPADLRPRPGSTGAGIRRSGHRRPRSGASTNLATRRRPHRLTTQSTG